MMFNKLAALAVIGMTTVAGVVGYRLVESQMAAEVYRHRLVELNDHYEQLRKQYNDAVRKTAVTELVVKDGKVSVRIRTAKGVIKTIHTPFKAGSEIYVDYLVLNGRLWIRRVFDQHTPPGEAVTINPNLAHIDWKPDQVKYGKAAYRALTEGRWIVTVTGGGSLGLRRAGDEVNLETRPKLTEYKPLDESARADVRRIGPGAVLRRFFAGS